MSAATPKFVSLQSKLLGALALGLAVILLCALGGLGTAWLRLLMSHFNNLNQGPT